MANILFTGSEFAMGKINLDFGWVPQLFQPRTVHPLGTKAYHWSMTPEKLFRMNEDPEMYVGNMNMLYMYILGGQVKKLKVLNSNIQLDTDDFKDQ